MSRAPGRVVGVLGVAALAVPLGVLALHALSQRWFHPDPWPDSLTLDPALDTLAAPRTRSAALDGLGVGAAVTALALLAAWPAARALAERRVAARGAVLAVLFVPSLLPPVGLALGVNVVLLRLGLAGGMPGVVVAHLVPTLPYAVLLLTATLVRLDPAVEAQAAVLGASPWQRARLVTLPAARGGIGAAAALVFVVSWGQYLLTLLAGGGQVVTLTMLLFAALSGGNPTTTAVIALATAAPALAAVVAAGVLATGGEKR